MENAARTNHWFPGEQGARPAHCCREKNWTLIGKSIKHVAGCIDVDLGFTPATNLIVIRRLSLEVGQSAKAPAAYLLFPKMRMLKLPQTYCRVGRTECEYTAPTVGYSGTLEISTDGAVINYPGLFEQVILS